MTGRGGDRDHGRLVSTGRVSRRMVGPPLRRGVHRLEERRREGGREGERKRGKKTERERGMCTCMYHIIYIVHSTYTTAVMHMQALPDHNNGSM